MKFFASDMEHCQQQAYIPELIQDEDVHHPGSYPHAVWCLSQSLQPPVRSLSALLLDFSCCICVKMSNK